MYATSTTSSENLPSEEIFDVLAAVGNLETKAITVAAMADGHEYGKAALYHSVGNLVADYSVLPDRKTLFSYCGNDFEAIGLVAKSVVTDEGVKYQLTEKGVAWGLPIAGWLLSYSAAHPDFALRDVLGPTNTTDERRPTAKRIAVIRHLAGQDEPLTIADVSRAITGSADNRMLASTLHDLSDGGVVDMVSANVRHQRLLFEVLPEAATEEAVKGMRELGRAVISRALAPNVGRRMSVDEIIALSGAEDMIGGSSSKFRQAVRDSLQKLEKRGLLIRQGYDAIDSAVLMSESQKSAARELLQTIDAAIQDSENWRTEGVANLQSLAEESKLAGLMAKSLTRTRERMLSTGQKASLITEILRSSDDSVGLTPHDIAAEFSRRSGKKISGRVVRMALNDLLAEGSVHFREEAGQPRWLPGSGS